LHPLSQRPGDVLATARTALRCTGWVHRHHLWSSFFRFDGQDAQELAPATRASIVDGHGGVGGVGQFGVGRGVGRAGEDDSVDGDSQQQADEMVGGHLGIVAGQQLLFGQALELVSQRSQGALETVLVPGAAHLGEPLARR
jgi:hypothetical protein